MKQDLIIGIYLPDHNLTCVYLVFLIYVTLFIFIKIKGHIVYLQLTSNLFPILYTQTISSCYAFRLLAIVHPAVFLGLLRL